MCTHTQDWRVLCSGVLFRCATSWHALTCVMACFDVCVLVCPLTCVTCMPMWPVLVSLTCMPAERGLCWCLFMRHVLGVLWSGWHFALPRGHVSSCLWCSCLQDGWCYALSVVMSNVTGVTHSVVGMTVLPDTCYRLGKHQIVPLWLLNDCSVLWLPERIWLCTWSLPTEDCLSLCVIDRLCHDRMFAHGSAIKGSHPDDTPKIPLCNPVLLSDCLHFVIALVKFICLWVLPDCVCVCVCVWVELILIQHFLRVATRVGAVHLALTVGSLMNCLIFSSLSMEAFRLKGCTHYFKRWLHHLFIIIKMIHSTPCVCMSMCNWPTWSCHCSSRLHTVAS